MPDKRDFGGMDKIKQQGDMANENELGQQDNKQSTPGHKFLNKDGENQRNFTSKDNRSVQDNLGQGQSGQNQSGQNQSGQNQSGQKKSGAQCTPEQAQQAATRKENDNH